MALLERESPLASLLEYARDARQGDGRLVLVAGEAGVGKSALVEQLQADLPGARWSWGMCDGLSTPRPLGPLFDLADQLGGDLLQKCQANAPRFDLFAALIRQINTPGSLSVVVLEDVHWADEASVDLLRFLGRRLRGASVLLIATYRDDGQAPAGPLRQALGELATQRTTRRMNLAPLSAKAVRVLARGSGLEPGELHRLTGGNPFYVTEVIHAGTGNVPRSARDAVLACAARLSQDSRRVLDVAALIGNRPELRLLDAAASCPPTIVDELLASGLVIGDGAWLRFRHEIARLAIEQSIPDHRRRQAHSRVLDAMRILGSNDDAAMAFHGEGAEDGEAVLQCAVRAARRASELGSHRESAAQYERALRFAGGLDPASLGVLVDGLADEFALLDRWPESAEANERALQLWRVAGDKVREADSMRRYARTLWRLCRGVDATAAIEQSAAMLEPLGPTRELAYAYADFAALSVYDDREKSLELALRARTLAERFGLADIICRMLNFEALTNAMMGKEWHDLLRHALDTALAAGLDAQVGLIYTSLQELTTAEADYRSAEKYYVDGVTYCDDRSIVTYGTCLRGGQITVLEHTGRWDEAVSICSEILAMPHASPANRINPLVRLGVIRARRGEPGARECLVEAVATADRSGCAEWITDARLALAEAFWLDSDTAGAAREVELAGEVAGRCNPWVVGLTAAWAHRLGLDHPYAVTVAEPYRPLLTGDWDRTAHALADLGRVFEAAMVLLESDKEAPLRQALATFQDLGATATARLTRRRMRERGLRSIPTGARSATRSHPVGLTSREQEVLELICGGHTNAAIAARLVISTKTVDHHVTAVLAKLGTPSRGAAMAEAFRLHLVEAPPDH
jgi:DNA-binding CsgD family transcriptional regulator/tetratricopeptide (TPR) repeat protein